MAERMTVSYQEKPCYDIVFTRGFEELTGELSADTLDFSAKKICIVTDSNVGPLYAASVKDAIIKAGFLCDIFTFEAGEQNKNLDIVKQLYTFLIEQKYGRSDMLAALGGGVVGDLTGFTAATYLRGIDFIQIPTTLLAQVDSSIGGKTGVDFDDFKNMVGAFHMPRLVFMNMDTLTTLDGRQFVSGFAESMKAALIKDSKFYEWQLSNLYEICERDPETMLELVKRSCSIKRLVVEKDPTEKGERALLNLGHTLGHAIEKVSGFTLLHGECVALGCIAAAYISWKKDMISMEEFYEIRDMFVPFGLPITLDSLDIDKVIEITKSDKKVKNGHIKFVLLHKIGKAVLDDTVTDDEMRAALDELIFKEEV